MKNRTAMIIVLVSLAALAAIEQAADFAVSREAVPYIVGTDGCVWRYHGSWERYGTGPAKAIAFPR